MKSALTVTVFLAVAGVQHGQPLAAKRALTLEAAKKIAAAAEAEAIKNKWTMFITVADDSGTPLFIERLDETQLGSFEVSIEKARTAVFFKRPTKAFEDQVAGGRTVVLRIPGALPVEGGIPLMADGKVIGGIGVSGGTSAQDAQVAQAGVAALEAMLKGGK
ncbi:MAG TPA: heme-binding protein [Terriglobia bacterium]|nr:heme-binding protein [Terriglobia bacterium]